MAKTIKNESQYVVTLTSAAYYRLHACAKEHLTKMSEELVRESNKKLTGWSFEHALKCWKQAVESMACMETYKHQVVEKIVETPDTEAEAAA